MADEFKNVDKTTALLLELVGIIGFLGIGHIYAGKTTEGIIRLVAWLAIIVVGWTFIGILSMFLIGICLIPFMLAAQLGVPIWSGLSLKKRLEQAFPEK